MKHKKYTTLSNPFQTQISKW